MSRRYFDDCLSCINEGNFHICSSCNYGEFFEEKRESRSLMFDVGSNGEFEFPIDFEDNRYGE